AIDDRPAGADSLGLAVLPRSLGGTIRSPDDLERERDGPDARVVGGLKSYQPLNRFPPVSRVDNLLNFTGELASFANITHDRVQQFGTVREVKVEGLTRDLRLLRDLRHRGDRCTTDDNQLPRRVEYAVPRCGT